MCLRSALLINYCSVFLETLHAQSTQPGESKKPKIIEFWSIIRKLELIEVWGIFRNWDFPWFPLVNGQPFTKGNHGKSLFLKILQTSMSSNFLIIDQNSIIFGFLDSPGLVLCACKFWNETECYFFRNTLHEHKCLLRRSIILLLLLPLRKRTFKGHVSQSPNDFADIGSSSWHETLEVSFVGIIESYLIKLRFWAFWNLKFPKKKFFFESDFSKIFFFHFQKFSFFIFWIFT